MSQTWSDLWPLRSTRRQGALAPPAEHPLLHVGTRDQGYLNSRARRALFAGQRSGWVRYQTPEGKLSPISLVAVPPGQGYKVSPRGQIVVTPITDLTKTWPLRFRLAPHATEPGRLVLAERLPLQSPNGSPLHGETPGATTGMQPDA